MRVLLVEDEPDLGAAHVITDNHAFLLIIRGNKRQVVPMSPVRNRPSITRKQNMVLTGLAARLAHLTVVCHELGRVFTVLP